MANNNDYEGFHSSFNNSLGLIQQIDGLLNSATTYYINGDLSLAWRNLRAIQGRIIQLCNIEEVIELDKAAELAGKYIGVSKQLKQNENGNSKVENIALKLYERYNELIMRKLHDSKLLLQAKKDSSKMNF